MYDLIGDIHGHCSKLEALLTKLGYDNASGRWIHPTRSVIFVGDYIDRGPEIRQTLRVVHDMVDAGSAIALLGNHEYNAVAYHTATGEGEYLRSHNKAHTKQHEETLKQFAGYEDEWLDHLIWFYTLPLFIEKDGLRAVHACWDQQHIDWLKERGHFNLSPELLHASHVKGSEAYRVINDTLKGSEFNMPEGYTWLDKDGHPRNENRIRWWTDPAKFSFGDLLFDCPPALSKQPIPADLAVNIYPKNAPPVFFGHYWLEDKYPIIQADNVVCLDYSVAKGGSLVAYRWSGEQQLDKANFVVVR